MAENAKTQDKLPADEAQQDVAETSGTKAEAAATATVSDELTDEDLKVVAGGLAAKRVSSI